MNGTNLCVFKAARINREKPDKNKRKDYERADRCDLREKKQAERTGLYGGTVRVHAVRRRGYMDRDKLNE